MRVSRTNWFLAGVLAVVTAGCGGGSDGGSTGPVAGTGGPVVVGQNGAVDVATAGSFAVQMLNEVNAQRARGAVCGTTAMPAVSAIGWNSLLTQAAQMHVEDMMARNYFAHMSPEGKGPGERAAEAGYQFTYVNETLASGATTIPAAMRAWMASPSHCAAIMSADPKEMGAAFVRDGNRAVYMAQVFGAP